MGEPGARAVQCLGDRSNSIVFDFHDFCSFVMGSQAATAAVPLTLTATTASTTPSSSLEKPDHMIVCPPHFCRICGISLIVHLSECAAGLSPSVWRVGRLLRPPCKCQLCQVPLYRVKPESVSALLLQLALRPRVGHRPRAAPRPSEQARLLRSV